MRQFLVAFVASLLFAAAAQAAPGVLRAETETVSENAGSVTVSVLRRHGSIGVVTVDYATTSSTAIAGHDFVPVSGSLTFQDGEVSKFVTITLIDNKSYDGNRKFFLTLTNPTGGATIDSYPVGEVHIMDDELPPNVSINDIRVIEGNSGTTNAEFTITISSVTRTNDILMLWRTNAVSATAGSDFESSGGSFVFTPADTQRTISVPIYGDTEIEDDESFNVYVYGGATFVKQYGYCTIVNDDSNAPPASDINVGPSMQSIVKGASGAVVVDAGSTAPSPQTIGVTVSDRCIEAPSSVTLTARRTSIPIKALSAPCSAHVDVTFAGRTWSAGIVTYDAVTVTFDPPQPKVYVGQKTTVRAIVSPFDAPLTLHLDLLGGTAAVPSSVDVGANGGTFTIEGLAPGMFGINAALPSQNGGGMAQLFGEVTAARGAMTIAQLSPTSGPPSGGTSVALAGANVGADCTIAFGDARAANVASNGDTSLTTTTPAHPPGTVDVIATCGDDTFTLANAFTFTGGRRRTAR